MHIIKTQRGQILPLGLALCTITLCLVYFLMNTGQEEFERLHASNIVDAAVFSGLSFQARSLNYMAYTNRAMIANQVTVGQIVSTASWLTYVSDTARTIGAVVGGIPLIGPILTASANSFSSATTILSQVMPILLTQTDMAIRTLQTSQALVYGTTTAEIPNFIHDIIKANDQRYELTSLGTLWLGTQVAQWAQFTRYMNSSQSREDQATLIRASTDAWILHRDQYRSAGILNIIQVDFVKRGLTELVRVRERPGRESWHWEARDAAAVITTRYEFGLFGDDDVLEIPFPSSVSRGTGQRIQAGRRFERIRRAEGYARMRYQQVPSTYNGLGPYMDLSDKGGHPELTLALEVGLRSERIKTSDRILEVSPGTSYAGIGSSASMLTAVSRGRLFFDRPSNRSDGQIEYANLYNPYWIVRLTDSRDQKLQSWMLRGIGGIL